VLASGISSQMAGRVQRFAGISQLSIDPIIGSNEGDQGARIAIQQRVNSNLFVLFSTDVTSSLNQVIQVRYQLSPRWSVAGDRDQNGGFGFNVQLRKEF
jgi:translocation and assembly module TamB